MQNGDTLPLKHIAAQHGPIAYNEQGQGQPIILIHGSACDLRIWQPLSPRLAEHFRVIAYSRRQHWPVTGPFQEYSFFDDVEDLLSLIRHLGIESAHLVAHSSGSLPALAFALRYPEMVSSLVLFDPNADVLSGATAVEIAAERHNWLDPVRNSLIHGDDQHAANHLLAPLARSTVPEWFASMISDNLAALHRQFTTSTRVPQTTADELRRISAPVLILEGEESPQFFKVVNAAISCCIEGSRRETVPHCGHLFQLDAPLPVADRVLHFIGEHKQEANLYRKDR